MVQKVDLAVTPIVSAILDTGDTVTATVYVRGTATTVAQTSNACTESPASSGKYNFTFNPTSWPATGKYQYTVKFTGALQTRWVEVDWEDERLKYQDATVFVDTTSSYSTAVYPHGTPFEPINNWTAAKAIAAAYGFSRFHIKGNITLDSSVSGKYISSDDTSLCTITLGNQNTLNTIFERVKITGVCNGSFVALNCQVSNVTTLEGRAYQGTIDGTNEIKAGGAFLSTGMTIQSLSGYATFDCGGSGTLALSGCEGVFVVTNVTNAAASVAITGSYVVTLDSSITAGLFYLAGFAVVTNSATSTTSFTNRTYPYATYNEYLDQYTIPGTAGYNQKYLAYSGGVHIDTVNGHAGTAFPVGSPYYPSNNLADTLTVCAATGEKTICVHGALTLSAGVSGYRIVGGSSRVVDIVNMNGQNTLNTLFDKVTVQGAANGSFTAKDCIIDSITGAEGNYLDCGLKTSIATKSGGTVNISNAHVLYTTSYSVTMTGTSTMLLDAVGDVTLTSMSAGVFVRTGEGTLTLTSSVSGGIIVSMNIGTLTNNSVGGTVYNYVLPSSTWNELIKDHQIAGSMGANQQHGVVKL